jgi:hypothetical protein
MSSLEIRNKIIEQLSHIDDIDFLKAINKILESKASDDIYKLNKHQIERIEASRLQVKKGATISNDDLQKEIREWLDSK